MKCFVRKTHKYLSFFISLQLLLWTISGIYFAFNKIESVRGEQYLIETPEDFTLNSLDFEILNASEVSVRKQLDKTILVAKTSKGLGYYDSEGNRLEKLSANEVKEIVRALTSLRPNVVTEITKSEKGVEYRGRRLPLFKISAKNDDDELVNVYVDAYSGDIVAIRSIHWQIWDLMWGFHIMDWIERDNINNILLKIFSILALVSSISGLLLFFKIDWPSVDS